MGGNISDPKERPAVDEDGLFHDVDLLVDVHSRFHVPPFLLSHSGKQSSSFALPEASDKLQHRRHPGALGYQVEVHAHLLARKQSAQPNG